MEDNRYLEQAAALLDKAKEAGEIIGVVLATSGYKECVKVKGSSAALINTMINLTEFSDKFNRNLALTVAAWIARSKEFAVTLGVLLSNPKKLESLLQETSDNLDAGIAEYNARRDAPKNETEEEESHDSEEAA